MECGWNPIRRAVCHNNIGTLKSLLSNAYWVSTIDKPVFSHRKKCYDYRSALYHAVQNGQLSFVKLLLEARADPHKKMCWQPDTPGRPFIATTPFEAACKLGGPILAAFNEVYKCPPPPLPERCCPPEEPPKT